jgi:UDP-GlcNAc:undecaprenyl-phosphate/decaprenyl-phosphate GlcNAc-1-phosphate transferase
MSYIITFFILVFSISVYFKLAKSFRITDSPNERSSHSKETFTGGGIIFPVAILIWLINNNFSYLNFFYGFSLIAFISFLDDIFNIKQFYRILFHIVSVLFLFFQLNLFLIPPWISIFVFFIVIGWINAFNFMDGINGISVFYSGISLLTFYLNPDFINNRELMKYMAIALIVFGNFNVRKNTIIFLGDVGSVSIAFVLAFLMMTLIHQTHRWEYIIFFSIYGVDTVLTIIQRILRKENIFNAHRLHLYQFLVDKKNLPHLLVSAIYSISQLIINVILLFVIMPHKHSSLISCFLLILLVVLYTSIKFKYIQHIE